VVLLRIERQQRDHDPEAEEIDEDRQEDDLQNGAVLYVFLS
jgi:hypothetical protein